MQIAPVLAAFMAALVSCSGDAEMEKEKLSIVVTIPPQAYFVEKIAGEKADISIILSGGKDPHFFEFSTREISQILSADIYFSIGLPQEAALVARLSASSGTLRIVDTGEDIPRRLPDAPFLANSGNSDTLPPADEENTDPHIWLSPALVKLQAQKIIDTLIVADPKNASYYISRHALFITEIDNLDREIQRQLSVVKEKTLLVYHPAFGYFADQYGFTQIPVEIEGKEPAARSLSILIETARRKRIRTLFVEPQTPQKKAQIIASSIGAEIMQIDPLARNWTETLLDFAKKIGGRKTE